MKLRSISMAGAGLIATACLLPLAPATAQTPGDGPAHVMRVQQDLNDNGFKVPVNGVMGAETVGALRRYQQQHGLPPTGQIDAQTFTELEGIAAPDEQQAGARVIVPGMAPPAAPGSPPPG